MPLDPEITYVRGARTARARLRGDRLLIRIPHHWPVAEQQSAIARFRRWGVQQLASQPPVPDAPPAPPLGLDALRDLVVRINAETFRVAIGGVRLGSARYTRLAQINLRTRVITFSRYAVDGMPPRALRYLILHELAHVLEANHSSRFWALVARHEPDYRRQRRIAQDHYRQQVAAAERAEAAGLPRPVGPAPVPPAPWQRATPPAAQATSPPNLAPGPWPVRRPAADDLDWEWAHALDDGPWSASDPDAEGVREVEVDVDGAMGDLDDEDLEPGANPWETAVSGPADPPPDVQPRLPAPAGTPVPATPRPPLPPCSPRPVQLSLFPAG